MKPADVHWLLELMVIDPVPLAWILPAFNGQHTNSPPIPGYGPPDYAHLLIWAIKEGLIQLTSGDHFLTLESAENTVTRFEQLSPRNNGEGIGVRMTDKGGKAWESLAEPQWDRFFKFALTYLNTDPDDLRILGLLASRNRDAVMAYLGWYERLESIDVHWDTLRIVIEPEYEATYWKRLTDVHEATFNGIRQRLDRTIPPLVFDWKISLGNWHAKPWDRADWG